MEQLSYGLGYYLGQEIREGLALDDVEVTPADVIGGFTDGLRELDPAFPPEQIEAALAAVHRQLEDRMVARLLVQDPQFKRLYDENLARSRRFHETFGREQDVVTLPGGIQYKVLDPGAGASPGPTDVVVINIRISLIDGTELARGDGAEVRIDLMVEAGARVLPRMKVGATWLTAIPPELAYGPGGRYPDIGPNETILAEVQLVEIR
jgi:FKBP-type peptidyl-prolyl cis-trans isomerase FklB